MTTPLQKIAEEIARCQRCPLHVTRIHTVPGDGAEDANIMIIGEAPGQQEDRQGVPFVGASGKFMDQMLRDNGIDRQQLFVTNVVKCRPPQDREPTASEKAECRPWLDAQIAAVDPRMIVTMGAAATKHFKPDATISRVRARPLTIPDSPRLILPMYHPAAAMHRESLRTTITSEFARIRGWMDIMQDDPQPELKPGQQTPRPLQLPTPPPTPDCDAPTDGVLLATIREADAVMRTLWEGMSESRQTDPESGACG